MPIEPNYAMKPYYKLRVLAILLPLFSSAQNNYTPGYVVSLNGDTLRGELNYREWDSNPKQIRFKGTDGKVQKLGGNNIRSFGANIGHLAEYQRYIGALSMNKTEINHLPIGKDTTVRFDTVFLKVVQKGKYITLLTQSDSFKDRFFVEETSAGNAAELIYQVYWNSSTAGAGRTVYENIYQRQLYGLAQKFNAATDDLSAYIEKSEYREDDLLKITAKINGISEKDATKNNRTKAKPFNVFIAIAAGVVLIVAAIVEFSSQHN